MIEVNNINLEKYPYTKKLLLDCESLLEDKKERIASIDFKSKTKEEYDFYNDCLLETEMGADCSVHFKNYPSAGLPPSSYGDWTSLYLSWLRESACVRLEYFLKNNIFTPFRFDTYSDLEGHKIYEIEIIGDEI